MKNVNIIFLLFFLSIIHIDLFYIFFEINMSNVSALLVTTHNTTHKSQLTSQNFSH